MFGNLSDRISQSFKSLRKKGRLTEEDIDAALGDIRRALIAADVALPVVRSFITQVREKSVGVLVTQGLNPAQEMVRIVNDELIAILGGESRELNLSGNPSVIMLAGLQGAGKTTLAGKIGKWIASQGRHPLLVACDLQRPNAVNQLQVVGQRAGVPVYAPEPGNGVGDPIKVASDSLLFARQERCDVVIIDTAGRLGIDAEMMDQARRIRAVTNPQEVLFVLDAMVGQDAVNTSLAFQEGVGYTGVVLSKLDGDARGGAALSVRGVTGVPVLFASTGEKLGDFERFHPDRMASRILDMGDVLTLIEQAQQVIDQDDAENMAAKLMQGNFGLDDFLKQLQQLQKLGPLKNMLRMLPGMNQMREALDNFDEREVNRIKAIVQSMTPAERATPKIINGQRRARIARGSGTTVADVNSLLQRFDQAATMMQQMAKMGGGMGAMRGMGGMDPSALGGMSSMRGLGNMPGFGKKSKGKMQSSKAGNKKNKSKKGRSGNPLKRMQQEAEAIANAASNSDNSVSNKKGSESGSAFGAIGTNANTDPSSLNSAPYNGGFSNSSGNSTDLPDLDEIARYLR